LFTFLYRPEGDLGSAGEQPNSNRVDTYTVFGSSFRAAFFHQYR